MVSTNFTNRTTEEETRTQPTTESTHSIHAPKAPPPPLLIPPPPSSLSSPTITKSKISPMSESEYVDAVQDVGEQHSQQGSAVVSYVPELPQQYLQQHQHQQQQQQDQQDLVSPQSNSASPNYRSFQDPRSPETVSGVEIIGDGVSVITELTQSVSVAIDESPSSPEFLALQQQHQQQQQQQQYHQQHIYQQQQQQDQQQQQQHRQQSSPMFYTDTNSMQATEPMNNTHPQSLDAIRPQPVAISSSSSSRPSTPNTTQRSTNHNHHNHHHHPPRSQTPAPLNPNAPPDEIKEHYEALLSHISRLHSNEIDSILEQLNSLEETYTIEIQSMQDELTKREIMTDALTNSLTEMRTKSYNDRNALGDLESENTNLREELRRKGGELERWRVEVQEVEKDREAIVEREETRRVDAVAQAQEEIRSAAEEQFAHAQQMFSQLKQDFGVAVSERDEFKVCADAARKAGEGLERKQKGQMAALMAELAEARAEMATAQADGMKLKQTYGENMQNLIDRENELEDRLVRVEKECKDTHEQVQQGILEKDGLKAENQELQNVCEELMGMVEGGKSK